MFEHIRAKVLSQDKLSELREMKKDKTIVFCSGCYDILQSGHAVFFNQCRQFGDLLVVGVGRDTVIGKLKGPGRPVNPENNRVYLVAAMHDVDYAVLNDPEITGGKIDFKNILEKLRPDVFVLNEDDSGVEEKSAMCQAVGAEIRFVKREAPPELEPTSTTRIIDKINFKYKAPLRIDFAGGWTDIPYIMDGKTGYVANAAISPLIEYKTGVFNFSGYPRGSGLSASTAVKLLEMISSKAYNADSRTLAQIGEDLFNLENTELNWPSAGRTNMALCTAGLIVLSLEKITPGLSTFLFRKKRWKHSKKIFCFCTPAFHAMRSLRWSRCIKISVCPRGLMRWRNYPATDWNLPRRFRKMILSGADRLWKKNFEAQIQLASASTNSHLDKMYDYAKKHGAIGGKIAGAGGGGAFIFLL